MKFVVYLSNNNYHPVYSGKQKNLFLVKLDVIFALLHLWENDMTNFICMKSFIPFFKNFTDIEDSVKCWNDIKLDDRINIVDKVKKNINAGYVNIIYCNMKIYDSVIVSTNGQIYHKSENFDYFAHRCSNCKENTKKIKEKEINKMFEKIKKKVLYSLVNPCDD